MRESCPRASACSRSTRRALRRRQRSGRTRRARGPGGTAFLVVPGRNARVQVRPSSRETAVPMFEAAPPSSRRPTWNTATTVSPQAELSGSTAVSCWLSAFLYGSTESRRETISQFEATLSTASALTMSIPAPQLTVSVPPNAACTRSFPAPATMRSGVGVPMIRSAVFVPRIVAAVAVDANSRKQEEKGQSAHRGCPEYPRCVSALDVDVLVIGSGFGGSVAALRLTEKGYRVAVLEAGRRFDPRTSRERTGTSAGTSSCHGWACAASSG